jgi:phosphoheptose isomerase
MIFSFRPWSIFGRLIDDGMVEKMSPILDKLFQKYQHLNTCRDEILTAFEILKLSYRAGGKLLICGNGGSAADSEHIVGELMKGYRKRREISKAFQDQLVNEFGPDGFYLAESLQGALPAISLASHTSLMTAISNDIGADCLFAQQVFGLGCLNDVLLGISTSGNSKNVRHAFQIARLKGMKTICLAGENTDRMKDICDVVISVPWRDTYEVQESHVAVYHALCGMLEEEFFLQ